MKKIFVILVVALAATLNLSAQNEWKNEIGVSYGFGTFTDMILREFSRASKQTILEPLERNISIGPMQGRSVWVLWAHLAPANGTIATRHAPNTSASCPL